MTGAETRGYGGVVLPASLAAGVTAEWRRAFRPPFEAPAVVAINGLLMAGAWFLLPPDWFFRMHTARVFPIILAVWMLADVPATNVLGSDPRRMSAVLDSPGDLRRMLTAKNLVLWLLVVPICVGVALVVAVLTQATPLSTMATIAAITIVPFGALGVAAWLGILFPYHALPLRFRWQYRRPYGRMVVRWALLVVVPYGLVPLIAAVIILPVLSGWRLSSGSWATASDGAFALGVVIVVAVSSVAWFGGHAVGTRLAGRATGRCARSWATRCAAEAHSRGSAAVPTRAPSWVPRIEMLGCHGGSRQDSRELPTGLRSRHDPQVHR